MAEAAREQGEHMKILLAFLVACLILVAAVEALTSRLSGGRGNEHFVDESREGGPPGAAKLALPEAPAPAPAAPSAHDQQPAESKAQARLDQPGAARKADLLDRLVKVYPDFLARHDGHALIWRDGSRMVFDDGKSRSAREREASPDLEDQFHDVYPVGRVGLAPPEGFDPGRVRHAAFFLKMYGDCRRGKVAPKLATVAWLPKHKGKPVRVTSVNGVAARLKEVSDELDLLPDEFMKYLTPVSNAYNCRAIAGAERVNMHGYGAAIDINAAFSDYWRSGSGDGGYRNQIPWDIVEVFERHGFIWGGKWSHFETMHFEYRPELLPGKPGAAPEARNTP